MSVPTITSLTATSGKTQITVNYAQTGATTIQYKVDSGSYTSITTNTSGSFIVTGLTGGVSYTITLSCTNGTGTTTSTVTKIPYDTPTNLIVSSIVNSYTQRIQCTYSVNIRGSAITDIKYIVEASGEVTTNTPNISVGTTNPFFIFSIPADKTYYLRIMATNAAGNSEISPAYAINTLDNPSKPVITNITSPSLKTLNVYYNATYTGASGSNVLAAYSTFSGLQNGTFATSPMITKNTTSSVDIPSWTKTISGGNILIGSRADLDIITNSPQYVFLQVNTKTSFAALSQSVYLEEGDYHLIFYGSKWFSGQGDILNIRVTDSSGSVIVSNNRQITPSFWIAYNNSISIPSAGTYTLTLTYTSTNNSLPGTIFLANVSLVHNIAHPNPTLYTTSVNNYKTSTTFTNLANNSSLTNPSITNWKVALRSGSFYLSKGNTTYASDSSSGGYLTLPNNGSIMLTEKVYQGSVKITFSACCKYASDASDTLSFGQLNASGIALPDTLYATKKITTTGWNTYTMYCDVTNLPFYNNAYTPYSGGKTITLTYTSTNTTQPNYLSIKDISITPYLAYQEVNLQNSPQLSLTLNGNKSYPITVILKDYVTGLSLPSDPYTAAPQDLPSTPIITSITSTVNNQLNLYWSSTPSVGTTITDVKYSINGGALISGGISNPLVITGLSGGQMYSFALKSTTIYGDSSMSSLYYGMPLVYPEKPIITDITEPSNNTIAIYWKDDLHDLLDDTNGTLITNIKYSLDNGVTYISGGTSNPLILTGLSGGQLYLVKIKATNSAGDSVESLTGYTTPYDRPDKPIITSITAPSKNTLHVYWTNDNNGAEITSLKYSLDGSTPSIDASLQNPIQITGLTGGITCQIKIMTTNIGGNSIESDVYNAIPYDTPSKPIINNIVFYNDNYLVHWNDANNGATITNVLYSIDNSNNYITVGSDNPLILTGLSGGLTYPVKIKLSNPAGTSVASDVYNIIPINKTAEKNIEAPVILNTVAGNGQITVNFSHTLPLEYPIIAYQYSLNGGQYINSKQLASPLIITGLVNGASYEIIMNAINLTGISSASNVSAVTVPHDVPSSPEINFITSANQSLVCNITEGNNNGGLIKQFSYSLNGGDFTDLSSSQIDGSNITIPDLSNGTLYNIQFKQINEYGESQPSNIKGEIPYDIPVAPILINAISSSNSATINFIDIDSSANGFPIVCYKYSINGGETYHPIYTYSSPFTIYELLSATTYSVTIKSVTSKGESLPSNEISFSTFDSFTVVTTPNIISVEAGVREAVVYFTPSTSTASEFSLINYQYSLDGGNTFNWCTTHTDTSFIMHDLIPDTSYSVVMRSYSNIGYSQTSSSSAEFTPFDRPDAPIITNVVASDSQVLVYFEEGNDNGREVTSHLYSLNGNEYCHTGTITSPITIPNLTNTVEYIITIKSVNEGGESDASMPSSPVTPFGLPNTPIITNITVSDKTAIVDISANLNGDTILGFKYSFDSITWYDASAINGTPSFQVNDLSNGISYSLLVKIVSQSGVTTSSNLSQSFVPKNVPNAPVITKVTPMDKSAAVYFTAPSSNGATITEYWYSINDSPYKLAIGTVSPISIYGLDNGTNYSIKIKAVNSLGFSSPSNLSDTFIPSGVPSTPIISKLLAGVGSVSVVFDEIQGNGTPVTKIQYSFGQSWIDFSGVSSPLTISNLTNKTNVSVSIRAINSIGASYPSNIASVMVGTPIPPVITNVVSGDKQLTVYFDTSGTNGSLTSIMYGFSGSNIAFSKGTGTTSPIVISKLTNGTPYSVQLMLVNANGSSAASAAYAPIIPAAIPSAPVIASVTRTDIGIMQISVGAVPSNGSEIIKYSYSINSDSTIYDFSGLSSPFIISGLEPNVSYSFKVYAENGVGRSLPSAASKPVINTFVPPPAPAKLTVVPSMNTLTVSFTAPIAPQFTPITTYKYVLNGSGTLSDIYVDASTTTLPLIIPINNNTSYTVRVKSVNIAGDSVASAASAAVSYTYTVPTSPVIKSVTPLINGVATVAYTASTARNTPITGYVYTIDGGNTYKTLEASGTLLIARDLSNNVPISTFQIAATSALGYSLRSNTIKAFTIIYNVPTAPAIKSVVSGGSGIAKIAYTAATARNSPITGYAYTLNNGVTILPLESSGTFLFAQDLSNNVPITTLKIMANSALGYSALSAAAPSFTILYTVPNAPALSTPVVSGTTATIGFNIPASNGSPIIGFQYTLKDMKTNVITTSEILSTIPIIITNLAKSDYIISVVAINDIGSSPSSIVKAFTIK